MKKEASGVAREHHPSVREEAARRLIGNHELVLRDVCNPTLSDATGAVPLTQLELRRVSPAHVQAVDAFLREVARRLLGHRKGESDGLAEQADDDEQRAVWAAAAAYLNERIQGHPDEKP